MPERLALKTYDAFHPAYWRKCEANMTLESQTQYGHIEITPGICGGKPRIAGHRITVQSVAIWHERLVAPAERRDKVFQEVRRPVFSLLDRGPLAEACTYLSYDSVRELARQRHLSHMSDSILDEYEESAEG